MVITNILMMRLHDILFLLHVTEGYQPPFSNDEGHCSFSYALMMRDAATHDALLSQW